MFFHPRGLVSADDPKQLREKFPRYQGPRPSQETRLGRSPYTGIGSSGTTRRVAIWELNNRTAKAAGRQDCLWIGMNSGSIANQSRQFRDDKEICKRAEIRHAERRLDTALNHCFSSLWLHLSPMS